MPRSRQRQAQPRTIESRLQQIEFGPPLPCFRGYQFDVTTTVQAGGSSSQVEFDLWENGAPDVFEEGTVVPGTPPFLKSVDAKIGGVFALFFSTDFDETLAATVNVGLGIEDTQTTWQSDPVVVMPAHPRAGFNSTGHYSIQVVRGWPPIWLHKGLTTPALAPALPRWTFMAAQDSASDRETSLAMFEIYLLGGLSVDTSELGP